MTITVPIFAHPGGAVLDTNTGVQPFIWFIHGLNTQNGLIPQTGGNNAGVSLSINASDVEVTLPDEFFAPNFEVSLTDDIGAQWRGIGPASAPQTAPSAGYMIFYPDPEPAPATPKPRPQTAPLPRTTTPQPAPIRGIQTTRDVPPKPRPQSAPKPRARKRRGVNVYYSSAGVELRREEVW